MVKYMRIKMRLFVADLDHDLSKEGRVVMFIGDIDISKLLVYEK